MEGDCGNNTLPGPKLEWDSLLELDACKSMGFNEFHPKILKELADVITRPVSIIFFQLSWESGDVPDKWKLSNVPVFKKSKGENPADYRPVSLALVPVKIMEIILGVIEKQLKDNEVIGHNQHGFIFNKQDFPDNNFLLCPALPTSQGKGLSHFALHW